MADNVTVDNGALTDFVVSADEIVATGELLQRVKLAYSADGVATHVTADADGLLVNLGTNNDVTVTGTVDLGATDNAVLDAIAASVAAIDADATTIVAALQLMDNASVANDEAAPTGITQVGGFASVAIPTAVSADGDAVRSWHTRRGASVVANEPVGTATLSSVNDAATSASLLASNTGRKGVIIYNDSTQDLYLKYGATASLTSFTYRIPAQGHWEMPTSPVYTGAIDGIWAANASGAARITELS